MSASSPTDILSDTIRYLEQRQVQGVQHLRLNRKALDGWPDAGVSGQQSAVGSRKTEDGKRNPESVGAQFIAPTVQNPKTGFTPQSLKPPMNPQRLAEFEALRAKALACQKCSHLVKSRKQVVFGVGDPNAELMFVGEAPGADEDAKGEPFVGMAGQLLTKMILTMGFQRSDVYIGNVLKCRPNVDTPMGNRKPTPEEMETCIPWLKEQIRLIQPRVLVTLGDVALKGLIPSLKEGISKLRGRWLEFEGIPLMPTFHPAYLLRNQSPVIKRQCWEDLLAALEKLQKPISEKQRGYFLSAISGRASN